MTDDELWDYITSKELSVYRMTTNKVMCFRENELPKVYIMEYTPDGDGLEYILYKGVTYFDGLENKLDSRQCSRTYIPNRDISYYEIDKLDFYDEVYNIIRSKEIIKNRENKLKKIGL